MKTLYFICGLLILFVASSYGHTPGTVTVDKFTFDKILRNFDVVLAKFDEKYRMYWFYEEKEIFFNFDLIMFQHLVINMINIKNLLQV